MLNYKPIILFFLFKLFFYYFIWLVSDNTWSVVCILFPPFETIFYSRPSNFTDMKRTHLIRTSFFMQVHTTRVQDFIILLMGHWKSLSFLKFNSRPQKQGFSSKLSSLMTSRANSHQKKRYRPKTMDHTTPHHFIGICLWRYDELVWNIINEFLDLIVILHSFEPLGKWI